MASHRPCPLPGPGKLPGPEKHAERPWRRRAAASGSAPDDQVQVPQPLRPKSLWHVGGGHVCPLPSPGRRRDIVLRIGREAARESSVIDHLAHATWQMADARHAPNATPQMIFTQDRHVALNWLGFPDSNWGPAAPKHIPAVARRRLTSPDVPFTCADNRWTWPGVARSRASLAPAWLSEIPLATLTFHSPSSLSVRSEAAGTSANCPASRRAVMQSDPRNGQTATSPRHRGVNAAWCRGASARSALPCSPQ